MKRLIPTNSFITALAIAVSVQLAGLGINKHAAADDNRPLYVELTETAPGSYRIGLRVPPTIPRFNRPTLILPGSCAQQPDTRAETKASRNLDTGIAYRRYNCDQGLDGKTIEIRYPHEQAVATVIRMRRATGKSNTVVLNPGQNRWQVPEAETRSTVARDYLRLGIHHIWAGTDHLLFLVCLIFISGSLRRVLAAITGFTIAHSLTLALSALDVVRLSVPPIEAVIALSVVFMATELAKGCHNTLTWRHPIAVSSVFGLLHGLGFAAVLNEIGLPSSELVTGLLFFNLGVEIGQVLFAAVVLTVIALLHRAIRSYGTGDKLEHGLQKIMGYGVGCLAAFWLFERVANF